MPIMLIVMGGLVIMLTTLTHSGSQQQEQTILQTEARSALNRMEQEIRGAFTGDGSAEIVSGSPNAITFYAPDQYATTVSGTTQSSFHLREISYQVTSTGLLQRQFMTSTNTFPTASCLTCGGTSQWTWPVGGMSSWSTVVGSSGAVINTNDAVNTCKPANATTVPAVFCFYANSNAMGPIQYPQTVSGWNNTYWNPQPCTTAAPCTAASGATAGVGVVVVTLELSSGGSQPVKFVVSDIMTIRGTS